MWTNGLEKTVRGMKRSAQQNTTVDSKAAALREAAAETGAVELLSELQRREDTPDDLRERGVDLLVEKFDDSYPNFEFDESGSSESNWSFDGDWRDLEFGKLGNDQTREVGSWKADYEDGFGPGVFEISDSVEARDDIEGYLNDLFPNAEVNLQSFTVRSGRRREGHIQFELLDTVDVESLPDRLYPRKLHDRPR